MAKKKKREDGDVTNKLLWIAGGAAVTGTVIFLVQKNLKDQEELRDLRYQLSRREIGSGGGGGSDGGE